MTNKHFFKKTVRDVDPKGRVVLVRADYNVPLTEDGKIADDFKLRASVPTLKYLHRHGAKLVVMSHMGRPTGPDDITLSLEQVATRLSELLDHTVTFIPASTGDLVKQTVKRAPPHAIILLENLRFHKEEEANDEAFAKSIAITTGARIFVQDGFGVVHRAHASTDAITHYIPSVAGLLLEREYTQITDALNNPKRPLVAILGGAKVSDKIPIIERLIDIADTIVIGGAMANTLLAYRGFKVGASKVESVDGILDTIYEKATAKVGIDKVNQFLKLPGDVVVAKGLGDKHPKTVSVMHVLPGEMAFDIGQVTAEQASGDIANAQTIIWNGTLGLAEKPAYAHGSNAVAKAILANPHVTSIVGGGDTADFALHYVAHHPQNGGFSHVSTRGGASLELMSGEKLPGIEALLDA